MKKSWQIVKISEALSFQEGPGVRKHQFTTEGVKLLNVGNINDGQINLSKTKIYISENEAFGKYKHFLVDEGDLVIASSGIVVDNFHNKIAFIKKEHLPLCMNTSTIRFKVIDKKIIDINYFKYFLKTKYFSEQLQRLITGSAQLNFGPSHLKKIDLLLPPLEDQRQIVKILDEADALRQKRKQSIDMLDDYLKSMFFKMFGDPVKNPKGWKIKKLGENAHVKIGPFGSLLHKSDYVENGIPLVNPKHLIDNRIQFDPNNTIIESKHAELKPYHLREGDVVLARRGEIGRCGLVTKKENEYLCGTGSMFLRSNETLCPLFLIYLISTPQITGILLNKAKGITMKNLNAGSVNNLELPIPPIELQNQFTKIVQKTEYLKQKMLAQSEELENQFQALMQKAFKGNM